MKKSKLRELIREMIKEKTQDTDFINSIEKKIEDSVGSKGISLNKWYSFVIKFNGKTVIAKYKYPLRGTPKVVILKSIKKGSDNFSYWIEVYSLSKDRTALKYKDKDLIAWDNINNRQFANKQDIIDHFLDNTKEI